MKQLSVQFCTSLNKSKFRKKEGLFLVEGPRAIKQLLEVNTIKIVEIFLTDKWKETNTVSVPARIISDKDMAQICDSVTPAGIVGVAQIPEEYRSQQLPTHKGDRILFLEDVQDPGNMGTLLRSAVAFGFSGAILTEGCADPFAPKVVRSTGGALGSLWINRSVRAYETISNLQCEGYQLLVADLQGEAQLNISPKQIVALGNEGNGVSKTLRTMSDNVYTIPYESDVIESLNVAIAGSIIMSKMHER